MKKWPGFLLFIAFCLLPFISFSQRNNFQFYSLEQGLPQATIYCIIQDDRGYLWLGTDGGGLCRFDGVSFKTFGKKEGFNGQNIRSLLQDSRGRIWAGTKDDGIVVYDGRHFTSINKQKGLAGSAVLTLIEDKDGTIWAGTDDGGVNRIFSQAGTDSFRIEVLDESRGLSSNSVLDLHEDEQGHIWLATFGGVNILTFSGDSVHIDHLRGGREIPSDQITSIASEKNGTLWFGMYDGSVFKMDPPHATQNFKLDLLSRKIWTYGPINGFHARTIWRIFAASNGEVWFASVENGLLRKRVPAGRDSVLIFERYTDKEGLPVNQMLSVFEDEEKNIWIGTNGGGLCKFMGDVFAHYSEKDGLPSNSVQGLDMDSTGVLWFGTSGGGLARLEFDGTQPICTKLSVPEGLAGNTVLSVSAGKTSRNPYLWAAVSNAGITRFDGQRFNNFSEHDGLLSNSVYSIYVDRNGIVWAGSKDGISRFDGQKFLNLSMEVMKIADKDVNVITQDKRGSIWFGTGGGLARYSGDGALVTFDEKEGLYHKEIKTLAEDPFGNIWIGTNNGGLYRFDVFSDDSVKIRLIANDSLLSSNSIRAIIFLDETSSGQVGKQMVVGTDKGIDKITFDDKGKILHIRNYNASDGFIGVECNDNAMYRDAFGRIWVGTVKGLTRFSPQSEIHHNEQPRIHITGVKLFFKEVDWTTKGVDSTGPWFGLPAGLELSYADNHVTIEYAAISLGNPQKLRYRYMLEGADEEWSPERTETSVTFSGLSPGSYTFKVIAAGANGKWNETPAEFSFIIHPPWYRSNTAYLIYLILVVGGTYTFIRVRERNLQKEKKILEDKVQERTAEVVKQKEELEHQKEIIEEKNKDITDSINYAQKIQRAILPETDRIHKALPESFILFQPRDIVSGDFYWFAEAKGVLLLAAADCTGHGVPGAFMSMINTSLLNEAVGEGKLIPGEILDEARRGIIRSLKQKGEVGEQKDGMDISLVSLRKSGDTVALRFAGANNSMYIIRKASAPVLEEIDPDPMPVAISDRTVPFTTHDLELRKGDTFYLFTDGYADQFGGPKGKKFKYSQLKQLLLSMQDKSMAEQYAALKSTMDEWKGSLEQIDDILVIGVRI